MRTTVTLEPAFRVVPHQSTLAAAIDAARFNQLADELEDEAHLAKLEADRERLVNPLTAR